MRRVAAIAILLLVAPPLAWAAPATRAGGAAGLTIDLVGVPLADALSALARAAGVDLVVEGEMSGTVTVHLSRQTFDGALEVLRRIYRLDISRVGAAYVVRQLPEAASILIQPPQAQAQDSVIRTYRLRYAVASDVADELRQVLGIAPAQPQQGRSVTIGQPPQAPGVGVGGAAGTAGTAAGAIGSAPSGAPSTVSPGVGGAVYGGPSVAAPAAPSQPAAPPAPAPQQPSQAPSRPAVPSGAEGAGRAGVAVASDDRTNSVVVAAPYAVQLQVQQAIAALDHPEAGPGVVTPGGAEAPAVSGSVVSGQTRRYEVRYADPSAMASAIEAEVPGASVLTDARTNTLLVTGPEGAQRRVAALLRALDVPARQILIQSEILDISKSAADQLGIQWTWQPYTINQVSVGGTAILQQQSPNTQSSGIVPIVATLNALVSRGEGKVLANPQVATQDGVQAQIAVGQTLYVPITQVTNGIATTTLTQINAGILLLDTPRVNAPGEVTNSLNVQANSISGFTPQGYPNISQRSVSSIITVGDGQPILIGGLISDTTTKAIQKIPVLGDLPLVGPLFRFQQSQEQYDNIVVILTPHIIGPRAGVPAGSPAAAGR